MTARLRLTLLACAALVGLAAASSAMAAFTPKLSVSNRPATAGAEGTSALRVTVPRDDDALFKASFYVPLGYAATLSQAPGTQIGTVTAQVQVKEPVAGAVLPLTGTILVTDQASVATQSAQCRQTVAPNTANWVLVLAAAGQELRVPVFVNPTSGALAAVAAYVLEVCLPSPHIPASAGGATFGAKLLQAQLNVNGVFRTPSAAGTALWRVIATPWPNGPGLPNAAGTREARGQLPLPARVTLTASSKQKVLTIRGAVREGSSGVAGQRVNIRVGGKAYRATTAQNGSFRLTVRFKKAGRTTVSATASVPERDAPNPCSAPSPFAPVPCATETRPFFTVSRTLRARIR